MFIFITVLLITSTCTALPYIDIDTQNVITVPPNCPPGQEWINGQCKDVWRSVTPAPANVITVPPNCPPGQQWVNGACRDIWRSVTPAPPNVITVPPNCPPGQQWVNGACRDIWRSVTPAPPNVITVPPNCPPGQQWVNGACRDIWRSVTPAPPNVITVPPNCPPGQQWINGQCRDVWSKTASDQNNPEDIFQNINLFTNSFGDLKNVITVPPNCPAGQQFVNGQCRPIWRSANAVDAFFNDLKTNLLRKERDVQNHENLSTRNGFNNKNIINVPNQCPAGYRPDALGICRPIMK